MTTKKTKLTLIGEKDYNKDSYGKTYGDDDYWEPLDNSKKVKEKCLS